MNNTSDDTEANAQPPNEQHQTNSPVAAGHQQDATDATLTNPPVTTAPTTRAIAFPDDVHDDDKPTGGMAIHAASKTGIEMRRIPTKGSTHGGIEMRRELTKGSGLEIRRELTQHEKDLAIAVQEHIDAEKVQKDEGKDMSNDLVEHSYPIDKLKEAFNSNFNVKEPGKSVGLSVEDAATRLRNDGPNQLTPPKKKSAFRKVST